MFVTDKMYEGCFEDNEGQNRRDLSGETLYATLYSGGNGQSAKFRPYNSVDFCLAWCRDNGRKFINHGNSIALISNTSTCDIIHTHRYDMYCQSVPWV